MLNYAADPRASRRQLGPLFVRIQQALEPGGLFLLDVAEPGRERRTPRRTWHEGPDWLLCVEAAEAPDERVLRRRITVFRQANGAWRRSDELHRLRLYPRQALLDLLASTGFHTRLLAGYGRAARFRRGHAGILAIKPSDERSLKVRRGPRRRYCSRVCQNRSSVAAFRARRAAS
jgi:hypothetical protein